MQEDSSLFLLLVFLIQQALLYFYTQDYDTACSTLGQGYTDIIDPQECEAARDYYNDGDFRPFGAADPFRVESSTAYGRGCVGLAPINSGANPMNLEIVYNMDSTGGTGTRDFFKVCKNEAQLGGSTNSGGDPHFIGFHEQLITYQGECTLILLDSPAATSTGEDVTIHVRTMRKLDFSYISGVAMKIGEDIVEIKPNADIILNGSNIISAGTENNLTMSGLPFAITKEEKGTKRLIVSYSFDLGNGRVINVQANKKRSMMFVRTTGIFPDETTGMLGSPKINSEMVSRDGKKLSEIDVNAYGESWQVKDTDVQLFQEALGPQYPQKCMYEDAPGATAQLRGRRKLLAKKTVSVEEARAACASISSATKRELCVQDSISMGDLEIMDNPFYAEN